MEDEREVTITVSAVSKTNHGIKDYTDTWWNMAKGLSEELKEALINDVDKVGKGDKVKLKCDQGNNYHVVEILEKGKETDDDMIPFAEILEKAHKRFNSLNIDTGVLVNSVTGEPLRDNNGWIVRAVINADGKTYSAHGDASEANVGPHLTTCLVRMAETRAISRALRWALAEGTVQEEIKDEE